MNLKNLESKFKEKENFKKVFYNDNFSKKEFQRMEFLGDRVLALILSSELYKKFPNFNEGKLATVFSFLTSSEVIAKIAKKIRLDSFLKNKNINNISNKVLSDWIEAILGALYIDSGIKNAKEVIILLWKDEIYENRNIKRDAKSILQEWTQANGLGLPTYEIIEKYGSDHAPMFKIKLIVKKFDKITGKGKSLQIAQKKTAEDFINKHIKDSNFAG
tara:strand:- start:2149 stop:2799 length:651 start_codon:yes stop_codon:yes gene_type:complete